MAYSDPLSITISGTTVSLPRISTGETKSCYQSADGLIKVTAAHVAGRRNRHSLRIDHSKITPDPFIPAQNSLVSMSHTWGFDVPVAGYTVAEELAVYAGFKAMAIASSDLLISKLLAWES